MRQVKFLGGGETVAIEVQGNGSPEGNGSMTWKERKRLLTDKLSELASEIVTDADKLKAFAERWRGGFHSYSFHNLVLIWVQNEKATLCAGYRQWKKHGRYVKAGEKAIWILAPAIVPIKKAENETEDDQEKVVRYFFPVPVFDYSQTGGQGLLLGNSQVSGNGSVPIEDVAKAFGVPVEYSQGVEDGSTDGKSIRLSRRESKAQESAAFFHELAHIVCGHFDEKRRASLSREMRELEAESTSYLVCSCLGIDNDGAKLYLGAWHGDRDKLAKSALKVLSSAEKILRKAKPEAFSQKLSVQVN